MSKKYVAGCMNKIGIFYPMFRGTKDECFYFAKKFSFCYDSMVVRSYENIDELKPLKNIFKVKLKGE